MADREIIRVYVTSGLKAKVDTAAQNRDVSTSQWMKEAAQARLNGLDEQHEVPPATVSMLQKDGTSPHDRERIALFHILGSVAKFVKLQDRIYDFEEHSIRPEVLEEVDFSSGERKMILLGFNLYNGWECPAPYELFATLDKGMRKVAMKAIQLRFPC